MTNYFYDLYGRVKYKLYFRNPFRTGLFLTDSILYFYSGKRIYPDSIVGFDVLNTIKLSAKTIYEYSSYGRLLLSTSYNGYNNKAVLPTAKYVYFTINKGLELAPESLVALTVYPSPVSVKLILNTKENNLIECKIFDLQGKQVAEDHMIDKEINIQNLQQGIYIVWVHYESGSNQKIKFVKE